MSEQPEGYYIDDDFIEYSDDEMEADFEEYFHNAMNKDD